jgi:hypothetical protein
LLTEGISGPESGEDAYQTFAITNSTETSVVFKVQLSSVRRTVVRTDGAALTRYYSPNTRRALPNRAEDVCPRERLWS